MHVQFTVHRAAAWNRAIRSDPVQPNISFATTATGNARAANRTPIGDRFRLVFRRVRFMPRAIEFAKLSQQRPFILIVHKRYMCFRRRQRSAGWSVGFNYDFS